MQAISTGVRRSSTNAVTDRGDRTSENCHRMLPVACVSQFAHLYETLFVRLEARYAYSTHFLLLHVRYLAEPSNTGCIPLILSLLIDWRIGATVCMRARAF